ncbi:MAG: hypothetical protein ABFD07_17955 [Methanobacterium sp.]
MNKTEIHDKNIASVSKGHILVFIIGFLLLGVILELILGVNKFKEVIPLIIVTIVIIHMYIRYKTV